MLKFRVPSKKSLVSASSGSKQTLYNMDPDVLESDNGANEADTANVVEANEADIASVAQAFTFLDSEKSVSSPDSNKLYELGDITEIIYEPGGRRRNLSNNVEIRKQKLLSPSPLKRVRAYSEGEKTGAKDRPSSMFLNPNTVEEFRHNLNLNQSQESIDSSFHSNEDGGDNDVEHHQVELSPRPKFSSISGIREENAGCGPIASSSPFVHKAQVPMRQENEAVPEIAAKANCSSKPDNKRVKQIMDSDIGNVVLSPVLPPNSSKINKTAMDIPKVLLTNADDDQVEADGLLETSLPPPPILVEPPTCTKLDNQHEISLPPPPPPIQLEDEDKFDSHHVSGVNTFGRKIPLSNNSSLTDETLSKSFKFVSHDPKCNLDQRPRTRAVDTSTENVYASVKFRHSQHLHPATKQKFPSVDSGIALSTRGLASNQYFDSNEHLQKSPCRKPFKPSVLSPSGFNLSVMDHTMENDSPFGLKKNVRLRPNDTRSIVNRNEWRNKGEFFLSCLSLCMGLGVILRFPVIMYQNGGLAFLLVYSLLLLVFGLPLFYLECGVGQLEGLGPCGAWPSLVPLFSGLGPAMATISLLLAVRYSTLATYSLMYLIGSFYTSIPWSSCQDWWGPGSLCEQRRDRTETILESIMQSVDGLHQTESIMHSVDGLHQAESIMQSVSNSSGVCSMGATGCSQPPVLQFYERFVLELDPGGMRVLGDLGGVSGRLLGCQLVLWGGLAEAMLWGVSRVTGKVVMVSATLPLVLLPVLVARLLTVEGGVGGVLEWMGPGVTKWERVYEGETWREAGLQVMYGLGVVWGSVTVYGSRASTSTNLKPTAVAVCCIHFFYSILAAVVLAASLGHLSYKTLLSSTHLLNQTSVHPIESVPFIISSEALSLLPLPNLWSIVFFTTVMLAAANSLLGLAGVAVAGLRDVLAKRKEFGPLQAGGVAVLGFLASIPCSTRTGSSVIRILEAYGTAVPGVAVAMMEVLTAAWIYGTKRLSGRLAKVTPSAPGFYFRSMWATLPVMALLLLVALLMTWTPPTQGHAPYPAWAHGIGVFLVLVSLGQVVVIGVVTGGWNLMKGRGYWLLGAGKGFGEPGLKKCLNSNSYKSFGALDLLDIDQRLGTPMASPMVLRTRERKL